jgi:hypothetical protein
MSVPGGLAQREGVFAIGHFPRVSPPLYFLTAVGGGGRTSDTIHTNATVPRSWETFRLWATGVPALHAIQTVDGHYVTAVGAGGRTTDTIHTNATAIGSWELFSLPKLHDANGDFSGFGIQTERGYFLTAVGDGGHDSGDTIHTNATIARSWETFQPFRAGAFGTGSTYGIQIHGGNAPDQAGFVGWIYAHDPGDPGPYALWAGEGPFPQISWTLLKQPGDSYALITLDGYALTAIDGGAPGAGFATTVRREAVGANERFVFVDNGDFTACIRTPAGTYISPLGDGIVAGVSDLSRALRFRMQVFDLAVGQAG